MRPGDELAKIGGESEAPLCEWKTGTHIAQQYRSMPSDFPRMIEDFPRLAFAYFQALYRHGIGMFPNV
jgi:hypothetical protein